MDTFHFAVFILSSSRDFLYLNFVHEMGMFKEWHVLFGLGEMLWNIVCVPFLFVALPLGGKWNGMDYYGLWEGLQSLWKTAQVFWHDLTSIESKKTMSMEVTSTGVLDKNEEHYLWCKDTAEKWHDVSRHIQLHMSKYKKWRYTIIIFVLKIKEATILRL